MENNNVIVTSMVDWEVGITEPSYNFRRNWARKGAKQPIPKDIFAAICYEPGIEYLFKQGMLKVDDEGILESVGITKEDLPKVQLTNMLMDEYLSSKRQNWELKKLVEDLTHEQKVAFAQYAVDKNCTDLSKCETLSVKGELDVLKAIQFNKD